MCQRLFEPIPSSEITPESVYLDRRTVLRGLGAGLVTSLVGCDGKAEARAEVMPSATMPAAIPNLKTWPGSSQETKTSYRDVTGYNNFYEFGTAKGDPALRSGRFKPKPWTLEISGEAEVTGRFDLDDLLKGITLEERIYRLRCVEAWSMVIPWLGFPLARLLREAGPTSQAKYVRFESLNDPKRFPGQRDRLYQWPYVEGLRLDEAMNDLTLLATGVYGRSLPPQSGAPLRLVVPWKYGFKSIKSIVRIDLVDAPPTSLWMAANGREYGFYANVNPAVPHPRWLQDSERRIGELARRKTLLFNGYEAQVASLYAGMDLARNY